MANFHHSAEAAVEIGEPILEMKKYMVVLSHKKQIPEDGWDVALDRIRLYVNAENAKAAREMAVEAMEAHHLYCKVVYIRKLKGETK